MLRNWVTQFGFDAGDRAGDERISTEDRGKFIGQIGAYFGWNPPPNYNWVVEVTKDNEDQYIMVFMRYATPSEAERMLGTNYEKKTSHACACNCACHTSVQSDIEPPDPAPV